MSQNQPDLFNVKNLSGFYQALVFLLLTGLFSVLIGFLVMAGASAIPALESWAIFASYTLTFGWIFFLARRLWKVEVLAHDSVGWKTYLYIIPLVFILSVPLEGLVSLIPMPDSIREKFEEMITLNLQGFLTIGIAAPILEELIFRGVLLKSLLEKYQPKKAIIWSAIIFGVAHMNPWQFVPAFLIGLLIGWVYWKTQSIWPGIIIHFINNSFSFAIGYFTQDVNTSFYDLLGGWLPYMILLIICVILSFLLIRLLKNHFEHENIRNNNFNKTLITN